MTETETRHLLQRAGGVVNVGPAPIEQVIAAGRRRRRRTRIIGSVASMSIVGLVIVAVVGLVGLGRPPTSTTTSSTNPTGIPWWGDGELHLQRATVKVPRPDSMVQVADGVALWSMSKTGTGSTPVVYVDNQGHTSQIGRKSSASRLASDIHTGWVAWVNDTKSAPPVLVVYDTQTGRVVGKRELVQHGPRWSVLDAGDYPIAVEDGTVFYAAQDGDYRWDIAADQDPVKVTGTDTYLEAVQSGVTITVPYSTGSGLGRPVVTPTAAAPFTISDGRTRLSEDGRYVASTSLRGKTRIYNTQTGNTINTGLRGSRPVTAFAFGPHGTFTVALGTPPTGTPRTHQGPEAFVPPVPGPPYTLVTCTISTTTCHTVLEQAASKHIVLPGPLTN